MFCFILFMNLIVTSVFCQIVEEDPQIDKIILRSQSLDDLVTSDLFQSTFSNKDITQISQELTSEKPFEQEDLTTISSATTIVNQPECSSNIIHDILEKSKRNLMERIFHTLSNELNNTFELIERQLSPLTCLQARNSSSSSSSVELSWQIYENLSISLNDWSRVFDETYSHPTRTDDLNQVAGFCHNQVLVAAIYNESISLAAVGPANILSLNSTWNRPQQFGQVYWYKTSGKSFGFSPSPSIRQTSGDNEDLNSSLRLSWLLDQNIGGYRAGNLRSLHNNNFWRKVIFCN